MALLDSSSTSLAAWDVRTWQPLYEQRCTDVRSCVQFGTGEAFEAVVASSNFYRGGKGTLVQRFDLHDGTELGSIAIAQEWPFGHLPISVLLCRGNLLLHGNHYNRYSRQSYSWRMFDLVHVHRSDGRRRKLPRAATSERATKRNKV